MGEGGSLVEVSSGEQAIDQGEILSSIASVTVTLPEKPWMPTHSGVEIRVGDKSTHSLAEKGNEDLPTEVLKIGRAAVLASEIARVFSETEDPKNPDWYDKPWINLNLNSHLGGERLDYAYWQIYLRARTLGQTRGLMSRAEYRDFTDRWSNPYWTVPIPVDYPLNPADRVPYEKDLAIRVEHQVEDHIDSREIESKLRDITLFTDKGGKDYLEETFPFTVSQGNYPVWELGEYMIVTQDNPLVDRGKGVHLVLIYKGEQQGQEERFAFPWRDPRRLAEMSIIATAVAKIIAGEGYSGKKFDKTYVHLNANWSLGSALPEEERKAIDREVGSDLMNRGSIVGDEKWPGLSQEGQRAPGPNIHPHIQVLKEGCDLDLPLSLR